MPNYHKSDYQLNYARYKHYYRQIWKFYQKPAVKISSALLLTIFTTIFFAVFAIRPTLVTVAELLKTLEDRQEILGQLKKKAAALASAQDEYNRNEAAVARLDQAIPQDKDIQQLIRYIEATAADHQLVLNSVSIGEFEYRLNPSLPNTVSIPLTISLSADYPQLKDFLHDISRLPRFLSVDSIAFADSERTSRSARSDTGQGQTRLSIRMQAHYMPITSQEKAR